MSDDSDKVHLKKNQKKPHQIVSIDDRAIDCFENECTLLNVWCDSEFFP